MGQEEKKQEHLPDHSSEDQAKQKAVMSTLVKVLHSQGKEAAEKYMLARYARMRQKGGR